MNSSMGAMDPRSLRHSSRVVQLQAMKHWLSNRLHEAVFVRWAALEESFVQDLQAVEAELRALELKAAA